MDNTAIGRRIKLYRNKLGMTQAQLAEKLDVSAKYISSIERGQSSTSLNKLEKISKILEVDIANLISDCDLSSSNYANSEISALIEDWSIEQKELLINLIHILDKFFNK